MYNKYKNNKKKVGVTQFKILGVDPLLFKLCKYIYGLKHLSMKKHFQWPHSFNVKIENKQNEYIFLLS